MTSNEVRALAKRLGIQPCHVHANQLVDLAEKKDREGYRGKLDELFEQFGAQYQSTVNNHAKRQLRMQERDFRHNGWRSVWKEWQRAEARTRESQ